LQPVEGRKTELVNMARLDDVAGTAKVAFIKVDVQGAEAAVLRGMTKILTENANLAMLLEFWPHGLRLSGEDPVELLRRLQRRFKLEVLNGANYKIEPFPGETELVLKLKEMDAYVNLLCTPQNDS